MRRTKYPRLHLDTWGLLNKALVAIVQPRLNPISSLLVELERKANNGRATRMWVEGVVNEVVSEDMVRRWFPTKEGVIVALVKNRHAV